jgi:serine protease Do
MTSLFPVFGSYCPRAVARHRPRAVARHRGRAVARLSRFALLLAGMVGLSAIGTGAMAAMPPASPCDVVNVVAHALPAIVNITVVRVDNGEDETGGKTVTAAADKTPPNEHIGVFVGSGEVIDPSGIIVTNKHVIQGAAMIRVIFNDKTEVPAQLIAACSLVDLALLKVDIPKPLQTLEFADSDKAKLGQPVIAVGNPLGLGTSISTGVISATNRDLMRSPFDDYLQTDATINPGNSGGPLLNCDGEIVGVNTALLSNNKTLGSIGLGFALPANDVKFVASKLRDPDTDMPNWIGLHLQDLSSKLATVFGRPDMEGAIVTAVDSNGPAAQANIEPGDIVVGAEGHAWPDARAVLRSIVTQPSRAVINLDVWRNGHMMDVAVQSVPWPNMTLLRSAILASPEAVARAQAEGLGFHLAAVNDGNRKQYNLRDASGVLIDNVIDGSEAYNMGLKAGDVIEQVGMSPATTPDFVSTELAHGSPATDNLEALLVRGQTETRWVPMFVGHLDLANLVTMPDMANRPTAARTVAAPALPQGSSMTRDAAAGPTTTAGPR